MSEGPPQTEKFPRGAIDTLSNKLKYFEQLYASDIERVRHAATQGFTHVLRLPRANEKTLVAKYGPYFDKLASYHEFIKQTGAELNGYEPVNPFDSYYLFKSREDAERIAKVLSFRQDNDDLPISKGQE